MSDTLIFGYWGIRGRGQPLRHLLAYTGLKFQEKIYSEFQQYFGEKFNLGIDFPNLPYILDGDIKISQTLAIGRYIIRKSGKLQLLGKDAKQEAQLDNLFYVFWDDIIISLVTLLLNKKVLDLKTAHFYKNKGKYEKFQKLLAGREYMFGNLTMIDFFIAQGSYWIEKLFPEEYGKYPNIHKVRQSIEKLPQIEGYMKREKKVFTPFISPSMSAIPFFYPGTQPKIPPPPTMSPSKSSTSQKSQSQIKSQSKDHKVLIISGASKNSDTFTFMRSLIKLNYPGLNFAPGRIAEIQLFDEDLQNEGTEKVNAMRKQVSEADGILIGVTESHGNVSPVLVNGFNWLAQGLKKKKIGIVSFRNSQDKFRNMLSSEGINVLQNAELNVFDKDFLDGEGNVSGEGNLKRARDYLGEMVKFMGNNS